MSPEKIREHWRRFRAENPVAVRRRYGEWADGLEVPVLTGDQIAQNPRRVGNGTQVAELLIRDRYDLDEADKFYCFSEFDLNSMGKLPSPPSVELVTPDHFRWYFEEDKVALKNREAIESYFATTDSKFPVHLDYDLIRPKPKSSKQGYKAACSESEVN